MAVSGFAFSPAGDLAIGQADKVHLIAGGRTITIPLGDAVTCVAFRDARTLAIACAKRGVTILALGGAPSITRLTRHACPWYVMRWSPDGKYIAGGQYEPQVDIIDVAAGTVLRVLDPGEFDDSGRTALAFLGDTLYSTAYNKLVRWRWPDVVAGKARCRNKTGVTGHAHLLDLAVLPDGSLLALVDLEHESQLQRFAPTGEKLGRSIGIARAFRMAVAGDTLVLAGGEHAWLATHGGEPLRDLAVDLEDVGDLRELATHGDRVAIGGDRGYQLLRLE